MPLRLLVILLTFFVMGFGDVRGSFVGIAKEVFGISAAQGGLIPFCGAVAFGLFALPAGLLATRIGKKAVMVLGLLITAAGHGLPCVLLRSFSHLLAAVFIIGVGMTLLLVAGNPLLREVTAPERFARNLTFAQFIKSLGSISGPYYIALIVSLGFAWHGLFPAFALFSLATCLALVPVRIPEEAGTRPAKLREIFGILRDPAITFKILGIFLFAGSEMGMNTWLATHMWQTFGMSIEVDAIKFGQGLFWLAQGAGRILGTIVLSWLEPRRFLLACSVAGLAGLCGLVFGSRSVAVAAVAVCGATFANVWPTLFAILVESRPGRSSEIAGLTVMANLGGAVLPAGMGLVIDHSAVRWGFLVPLAAFLYLTVLASLRGRPASGAAGSASAPCPL